MNRFTFLSSVVAALLLATVGAALHGAVQPFWGSSLALRITLLGCTSGYLAFLLLQLRPRFGMTLIIASWLALAFVLMIFNPSVLLWISSLGGALQSQSARPASSTISFMTLITACIC